MDTTFSFTISTTNPTLAAQLSKLVSDFGAAHGEESAHVRSERSPAGAPDETPDAALVSQIVNALTYQPLHQTQTLALRIWYEASDWVHVSVLQQHVLKEGLAKDAHESVARVRGLLAGFAIRMGQKVTRG